MDEEFQEAVQALGNLTGLFDPFRVIKTRGLDGALVFDSILSKLIPLGFGVLILMAILELTRLIIESTGDSKKTVPVVGVVMKITLAVMGLIGYKFFVTTSCSIFPTIAGRILSAAASSINVQVNSALSTVQIESMSQFKLWTGNFLEMTVSGIIAAILSFLALILMWVMSLLQGFLFAFWYLIGPLALPCMVFRPMAHVMNNWMMSILGITFWSVTGALMVAICAKAQFIDMAFASGSMGDFWVSMVFSMVALIMMVLTAGLASQTFSAVDVGLQSAYQVAKSMAPGGGGKDSKSKDSGKESDSISTQNQSTSGQPRAEAKTGEAS